MNGIHDVGGADGFGPILVDENEPVFAAEWERAVFSFFAQGALAGLFNLDEFRHAIERMDPVEYLTQPYYAHWLHAFEEYLGRADPAALSELERRTGEYLKDPSTPLPASANEGLADTIGAMAYAGAPTVGDPGRPPQFSAGDRVLVTPTIPYGHTRKVGYARGRVGTVLAARGGFVYPDANAHGGGDAAEHVYSIQFSNEDIFGPGIGDPNTTITCDLWEPYLEPAAA